MNKNEEFQYINALKKKTYNRRSDKRLCSIDYNMFLYEYNICMSPSYVWFNIIFNNKNLSYNFGFPRNKSNDFLYDLLIGDTTSKGLARNKVIKMYDLDERIKEILEKELE